MSNGVNTASSDAQRVKVGDTGSTISITLQNTEGDAVTAVQWIRAYSSATINPEQYVDIPSYDVVDGVIYLQLPEIERGEYNIEIKDEDGRIYPAEGTIKLTMVSSTKDAGEVYYVTYRELILEDVTPIITGYLAENPDGFKGDKGDTGDKGEKGDKGDKGKDGTMSFEDLTVEQIAGLKGEQGKQGEKGDKFTILDFTDEEWDSLKGEDGLSAFEIAQIVSDFKGTEEEWLESLKGKDGTDGKDGEGIRYEDLTPEQKEEMRQGMSVRPPKIYTRAEYDALVSFDPHTLYFVVEEEEYGMPR